MKRTERLQVFQSAHNRRWYWRKIAGNGRIPAVGGEQFPTMSHAKRGALKQFPGLAVQELGLRRFPVPLAPPTKAGPKNKAAQPVGVNLEGEEGSE